MQTFEDKTLEFQLAEMLRQTQVRKGAMTMQANGASYAGAEPPQPTPVAEVAQLQQHATQGNRTRRSLPPEMMHALYAPLPPEALKPHPTKDYLSSVKAIYVIERLNQVFGIGAWTYSTEVIEQSQPRLVPDPKKAGEMKEKPGMIVVRVVLTVSEFEISLEQFGGSDNEDRGDAYKGAVTDALSKIASYLGIAMDVYKGFGPTRGNPRPQRAAAPAPIPPGLPTPPPPIPPVRERTIVPDPPNQVPWTNKGECRRAFAKLLAQLGSDVFDEELGAFSVGSVEDLLTDPGKAIEVYDWLVAMVRKGVA